MNAAKLLKDNLSDFHGHAALYQLSTPVRYGAGKKTAFVIVSAVHTLSGPETYIFPAGKRGGVLDWCEQEGSFRGGLNHAKALLNAGFRIIKGSL